MGAVMTKFEVPVEKQHCENCFYARIAASAWNECRRNPPVVMGGQRGSDVSTSAERRFLANPATALAEWPVVADSTWCGEWREKKG